MQDSRPVCPKCNHDHVVKNGHVHSVQRWKCRQCGYEFTRTTPRGIHPALKVFAILMYSTGKCSYGMIARFLGVSSVAVYKWIRKTAEQLPIPSINAELKEVEFDEMWHFILKKKNKLWIWKALDRTGNRTIAWALGNRSAATFQTLYDQVKGNGRIYYTDDWDVYRRVIPADQHIVGKSGTVAIERDNSNTRHYLARMTRKTKVVSKSVEMVDLSLRLWSYFSIPENYRREQLKFLSVFS